MKRSHAVNLGQLAYSNKQTGCVLRTSFLFVICLFLFSCSQPPEVLSLSGQTMGTRYHITLVNHDNQKTLASNRAVLQQKIDTKLVEINQLMSTYISDSEISRFNASPAVIRQRIEGIVSKLNTESWSFSLRSFDSE